MSATLKASPAAQTAGGATATTLAGIVPASATNNLLKSVSFVSPSGITSADTNHFTVEIGRTRAGSRSVVATATANAAFGPFVANVARTIPVTQTDPSSNAPGDLFDVKLTQVGTGLAVPAGCLVQIEIQ